MLSLLSGQVRNLLPTSGQTGHAVTARLWL
ncbi:hypothetical protein ABIA39_005516 [Nocardia sp. GAS34]